MQWPQLLTGCLEMKESCDRWSTVCNSVVCAQCARIWKKRPSLWCLPWRLPNPVFWFVSHPTFDFRGAILLFNTFNSDRLITYIQYIRRFNNNSYLLVVCISKNYIKANLRIKNSSLSCRCLPLEEQLPRLRAARCLAVCQQHLDCTKRRMNGQV